LSILFSLPSERPSILVCVAARRGKIKPRRREIASRDPHRGKARREPRAILRPSDDGGDSARRLMFKTSFLG
jgi:hypothetical protein